MMAKGKNVLTTGDVARICHVAPRTVSKWFDSGQLKGYRIPGSRDRRIPVGELVRFMKMHNMPTDALPVGKTRILIVDTDADSADVLANKLKDKADYEIEAVRTTFETGLVAQRFSPHVMLISLLSGDIDAGEICRSVRSDEDLQTVKLIAVANHLGEAERSALLQKGFDGYISKDTPVDEMVRAIERAIAIIY
ncbi:MAG: helix-turn-helix domain-containing protein [Phycisphaerae bacterium]|jgi:CheY-like chemotaxis protein